MSKLCILSVREEDSVKHIQQLRDLCIFLFFQTTLLFSYLFLFHFQYFFSLSSLSDLISVSHFALLFLSLFTIFSLVHPVFRFVLLYYRLSICLSPSLSLSLILCLPVAACLSICACLSISLSLPEEVDSVMGANPSFFSLPRISNTS